jgi:predicted O-methyltransferase YrrM
MIIAKFLILDQYSRSNLEDFSMFFSFFNVFLFSVLSLLATSIDLSHQEVLICKNMSSFNNAPEIGEFILSFGKENQIEVVVETGTYLGKTTQFFSSFFQEVHTIEISDSNYAKAYDLLKEFPNVHCHLGSSERVLYEILPGLQSKRALFYLDAHWRNYWPLLDELEAISQTHKDHCIVVIDDVKVPDREDIPYDRYKSNECSYEYMKEKLDRVFSKYDYFYLIPKKAASRAKLVAYPIN